MGTGGSISSINRIRKVGMENKLWSIVYVQSNNKIGNRYMVADVQGQLTE